MDKLDRYHSLTLVEKVNQAQFKARRKTSRQTVSVVLHDLPLSRFQKVKHTRTTTTTDHERETTEYRLALAPPRLSTTLALPRSTTNL